MDEPSIPPPPNVVEIDEEWMAEWVAYGLKELGAYLERHARFADYCDRRDKPHKEAQP